jgi:hypothetical protein
MAVPTTPHIYALSTGLGNGWGPWPDFPAKARLGSVPRHESVPILMFSGLVPHAGGSLCYISEVPQFLLFVLRLAAEVSLSCSAVVAGWLKL